MSRKLYDAIAQQILSELMQMQVPEGTKLPSEEELCRKYSCSRQTVRKALAALIQKGILVSRQGSGTFVLKPFSSKKSMEIAFLVPAIKHFIYPDILGGAESVFSKEGIRLSVYQIPNVQAERSVLQRFLQEPPDGIITTNVSVFTPLEDYYRKLRAMGIPVVITESPCLNLPECSTVTMDSFSAGMDAARILHEAGRTNLVGLFPYGNFAHQERSSGFLCGMDRNGSSWHEDSILFFTLNRSKNPYQTAHGQDTISGSDFHRIVDSLQTADGVFCGDLITSLVLDILSRHGRIPGEDVSILSITNSHFLDFTSIPVSALSHAKEKMGIAAAQLMIRLLRGAEPEHISLPFEFIDRGSI